MCQPLIKVFLVEAKMRQMKIWIGGTGMEAGRLVSRWTTG